jgi:hypothetical protein
VGQDVVEVIGGDETIIVEIGLDEYGFDFLIIQIFSKFLGNLFQFQSGDFSLN